MGFDPARFSDDCHQQFLCPICLDVADDPVMTACEHLFCKSCITSMPVRSCPSCRKTIRRNQLLKPMNRVLKNIYNAMKVKCTAPDCNQQIMMSNLKNHEMSCSKLDRGIKRVSCGIVFELGAKVHLCFTCAKDSERRPVAFCENCFNAGSHEGHNHEDSTITEAHGLFCDCGNKYTIKEGMTVQCTNHTI